MRKVDSSKQVTERRRDRLVFRNAFGFCESRSKVKIEELRVAPVTYSYLSRERP